MNHDNQKGSPKRKGYISWHLQKKHNLIDSIVEVAGYLLPNNGSKRSEDKKL